MNHYLGLDGGPWYNFFSGIFGVLVFGGGIAWTGYTTARKHNCHIRGCWRIGRYPAGEYIVCHRHHPGPRVTLRTVTERYHLYLGSKPGRG